MQVSICDPQISVLCSKIPSVPRHTQSHAQPLKTYTRDDYTPTQVQHACVRLCGKKLVRDLQYGITFSDHLIQRATYSPTPYSWFKTFQLPARPWASLSHDLKVVSNQLLHLFSARPTAEPAAWCHGARSPLDVTILRWRHYQCDMN